MRAIPHAEGINEVRDGYQKLQLGAKELGLDSHAAVIALEEKAGAIDTVSARGIPLLLREGPSSMDLLRRGIDIRILPEIAIDKERRRLLTAAGMVGLHGYNVTLHAVLDPAAFANTAEDKPRSILEKRSAATHVLHLAAHPFLNSDFRINESGVPVYHSAYDEVTAYRATPHSPAIGASAITSDGRLVVFQAPESIMGIDGYVTDQIRAAHESRPIGPVTPDGLTNHLAFIAEIARGEL
jgi:hypothetical protein